MSNSPFRHLPPVHEVLRRPELEGLSDGVGRSAVREAVRQAIEEVRARLSGGGSEPIEAASLALRAGEILQMRRRPHLRSVLNATGVLLHTGLGRAPLAAQAIERIVQTASGYCNLEIDLESGERGRRTGAVSALLAGLTGAEAATVVNNNAAATVLALRALASGREVVVSRGQLVEIGGSYRLPEVFEASGARLREVGTTNKTHLSDYERAIGPETSSLLRVHASNYKIVGFTESVPLGKLAKLARDRGILLIDDIGSGALGPGLPPVDDEEPTISESLAEGADAVLCSGDKLLGGPQCGLIVGRGEVIRRLEADPLMRALRVDKLTLAALEATLRLLREPAQARASIPLWQALTAPMEALRTRAERLSGLLRDRWGLHARAVESSAFLGGGSVPSQAIESIAIRLDPPWPAGFSSEEAVHLALRTGEPAVVGRVHGGSVWLDLRALPETDDDRLIRAISALVAVEGNPAEEPGAR